MDKFKITQESIKKLFDSNEEEIKEAIESSIDDFYKDDVDSEVRGNNSGKTRWFEIEDPDRFKGKKFPLKKIIFNMIYNKNAQVHQSMSMDGFGPDHAEAMLKNWNPNGYKFKFFNKGENSKTTRKESEKMDYKGLLEYQKQIILQGPPGTGKTRLAKIIARSIINGDKEANIDDIKDQVTLIQFHPSYSYEDFVRGIVAKTEEGENAGIKYVVENKILAEMAQKAKDSLGEEYFKKNTTKERKKEILKKSDKFIVIIDEINRANLSSVLGELIYALEYRDEVVESMYELEDENQNKTREIILPSNLYIIGTMNTADRSIGNMDYAIRRRFAFVDVPPIGEVASKDSKFKEVQKIFDDCTSPDFNEKKVRLGHSYFIAKNKDGLDDKLKYQIIPLLEEYISDGVLTDAAQKSIGNLKSYIDSKK